ncbi:MAG TPA: DUF3575 domain-containing protein [Chryseosolibacter sp.]|nr:DUF3575 domain-containing protein [Chryseosolibacter sp.]
MLRYRLPVVTTVFVLTLTSFFYCSAQYNAAIKAPVVGALRRVYSVAFEQAVNKHIAVEITLQGGTYKYMSPTRYEDYAARGKGVVGAFRYYPFTKRNPAPEGFFAYAAVRYIDYNEAYRNDQTGSDSNVGGNVINAGAGIGYKFAYRRLGLESNVGWGIGRLKRDGEYNAPLFFHGAMEEEEHFPQFEISLCYMLNPFPKK